MDGRDYKRPRNWGPWLGIRPLGRGGQGSTHLVRHEGDTEGVKVLKELNNNKDMERRKRMYREAANLRTLDHVGVPKFVDSNTDLFESDAKLYLVMEHIDGPTLDERIGRGVFSASEAIAMATALVDAVRYCHERNVGHRDIKPSNIGLRSDDPNNPVLLDFGLSFNEADVDERLTDTEQQLGNRFLRLPELSVGQRKRDPRADLASCCAVMLYAMTGAVPVELRDAKGLAPHERGKALAFLETLAPDPRRRLKRLFDRAFQPRVDDRWQSATDLRDALVNIMVEEPVAAAAGADRVLDALRRTQGQTDDEVSRRKSLVERAADVVPVSLEAIRSELLEDVARRQHLGHPLILRDEWNGNNTRTPIKEMVKLVGERPGWHAGVFHVSAQAKGIHGFHIYLEMGFNEQSEEFLPIELFLRLRHDGVRSIAHDFQYSYLADGRLIRSLGGAEGEESIVRNVKQWLDDESNWSQSDATARRD